MAGVEETAAPVVDRDVVKMTRAMNSMVITVNGEERQAPAGITVRALLEELEMPLDRVAVELNRRIIRKTQWDTTVVPEGAHLEVVHFVGGGCS